MTQVDRIIEYLKVNPTKRFTGRQIAQALVETYPQDYIEKRQNPRFADDKAFISQIVAEIGAQKKQILQRDAHIFWQDKPRPRVYWYDPSFMTTENEHYDAPVMPDDEGDDEEMVDEVLSKAVAGKLTEHELYPILINYLKTDLNLYCLRIDEKRSKNQRGRGGNEWLHPDVVAMQPVDTEWHDLVRSCVQHGDGQSVRLWSFEVKLSLTNSNMRKSFFQAVSNSSWANEGYLVTGTYPSSQVAK